MVKLVISYYIHSNMERHIKKIAFFEDTCKIIVYLLRFPLSSEKILSFSIYPSPNIFPILSPKGRDGYSLNP